MRNFKRLVALVVAIASLTFVFAGCGSSSSSTADSSSAASTNATAKGNFKIAFIAKNTVDAFHAKINAAAKTSLDGLVKDGTIAEWKMYDGQTDPVTQVNLANDAINWGANLIVILPAEAAGSAPVLEKAKEKNIPVIVVNSKTDNTDQLAAAYIGSNDVQAGEMMAKFIQEKIPNGGGYGHIQGIIGNSAQIERGKGLHNILDNDPKWKLLPGAEQTGEWQAEKAVKFAEDWVAKNGTKLNAIICDNDDMSSAVQTAMNAKNRKDIIAIGVDGNKGPLTMVKNGELQATIYQDGAAQVSKGIELGIKILKGEQVEKTTMIDFVLVTKDNVDKYLQ